MRKATMYSVRTVFYGSAFLLVVLTPQLICVAIGAPIHY